VTTSYCAPRSSGRQRRKGRGKEGGGLYPELAVLGIREGSTPALLSRVGRLTALLPSFAAARQELLKQGCRLNHKVVHRIAKQMGGELLDGACPRRGTVSSGLAAQRHGLGGQTRRRGRRWRSGACALSRPQEQGQNPGKKRRRKIRVEWREPKLLIIFEMDQHGRMVRGSRPWIDGTFAGPDETMELLAMHLHRLGAASAERVAFLADGCAVDLGAGPSRVGARGGAGGAGRITCWIGATPCTTSAWR